MAYWNLWICLLNSFCFFLFCYYNSDFDCVHSILTLSIFIIKCVCGVSIRIYCSKVYFYFVIRSLHTWFGFSKSKINFVVISVWFHTCVHHNNNIIEQRVFGSVSNQFNRRTINRLLRYNVNVWAIVHWHGQYYIMK